jgi:hypothetical protein
VDFKGGGVSIEDILGQFDLDLGYRLPGFSRDGFRNTHQLRKDLRSLRQPILVVFDNYEGCASNITVSEWLSHQFLAEVETALGLAVIVAGQQVPDYKHRGWHELVRYLPLSPIIEIEHWNAWVKDEYPQFSKTRADLYTVVLCAQGNPKNISDFLQVISKQ